MIHEPQTSSPQALVSKEKVVIIIPTYNEADVIKNTIMEVFKSVAAVEDYDIHILVFDSHSTDQTATIVAGLQEQYPQLHLESEAQKSGLGSAYWQAMSIALHQLNADIVFEFDADLSHQPKYLAPILQQIKTCDVVVGSRYVKNGSIPKDWAWHRKLFSVLGNYVARSILTPKYKDFTSGFRATRRHSLLQVFPKQFLSNHYAYKLHLLWLLHKSKAKITEFPIEFIDREHGESKLPKNSISDSLRVVFTLRYYEMKRYISMCLIGSIGMLIQFVVYNILRQSMSPFNASQFAVLAAIINNFILNNQITFKNKKLSSQSITFKKLTGFMLYSVAVIYLQSFWVWLGVTYVGKGPLLENLMLITGCGIISLLNYFTYSRHIWADRLAPQA